MIMSFLLGISIDEGLNMHGMHADDSNASVMFNIAFVLKDYPNSKILTLLYGE